MNRTCSICNRRAAWWVIDKYGFMEPGALCPGDYRRWAEWERDMVFIPIAGSKAVIDEYKEEQRARVLYEEKQLSSEAEFIQEIGTKTMEQIKIDAIIDAIESNNCNVQKATRELRISKASVYRAIAKHNIVLRRTTKLARRGK